jgi:hypothetical protein
MIDGDIYLEELDALLAGATPAADLPHAARRASAPGDLQCRMTK